MHCIYWWGSQWGDIRTCETTNSLYLIVGNLVRFRRDLRTYECLYLVVQNSTWIHRDLRISLSYISFKCMCFFNFVSSLFSIVDLLVNVSYVFHRSIFLFHRSIYIMFCGSYVCGCQMHVCGLCVSNFKCQISYLD